MSCNSCHSCSPCASSGICAFGNGWWWIIILVIVFIIWGTNGSYSNANGCGCYQHNCGDCGCGC